MPPNDPKMPPVQETDPPPPYSYENKALDKSSEPEMEAGTGEKATDKPQQMSTGDLRDDEVEAAKQARRERDPLKICKAMTSYPKVFFGLTLAGHLFFLFITIVLAQSGYDILPITFDRIPLDMKKNEDFLRTMAWTQRNEGEGIIERKTQDSTDETQDLRSQRSEGVELFFEARDGGNVFTKENLKTIKEIEEEFWKNSQFQSDFCLLQKLPDGSTTCSKPYSIIRFFDGSYSKFSSKFNDPNFDKIAEVLYEAQTLEQTNSMLQYFLTTDATITQSEAKGSMTRLNMALGRPLQGYKNATEKEEEQDDKVKKFMLEVFKVAGDKHFKNGAGAMDFFYSSATIISVTITSQVYKDMALAAGSLLFILVFVRFQTGSFWISGWAIMSIMTGFCCANIIYRIFFDFRYFGIFHILAVFIILGIGADDVFVFFDTWKETGHHQYPSLAHRLSDTYRKAAMAMLFTSLTTACAFIVSATSPFLGISSFGVFAGILVGVNYVSVIIFFPSVVVTYHLFWEKYKCCCCCARPTEVEAANPSPGTDQRRKNVFVRFFRGPYFRFVTHKVARWIILAGFLVLLIVFIYFAASIKINEEQVKFLPDSSNIGKVLAKSNQFRESRGEFVPQVNLVWGLKKQDLSECHRTDSKCTGKLMWDDSFNLNSEEAQNAMLKLCEDLQNLSDEEIDKMAVKKNSFTKKPEVECFVQELKIFMTEERSRVVGGNARYQPGDSLTYPLSETEGQLIMDRVTIPQTVGAALKVYDTPATGFNRYFEVLTSLWLYNGFDSTSTADWMYSYGPLVGEGENPPYTKIRNIDDLKYYYGTRLRYAAISVNISINFNTVGYPKGLPIRDAWEDWFNTQLSNMPESLKGGFQCVPSDGWHWLAIQKVLAQNAAIGVGVGIAIACPILIIATGNVIVGLMATLTIIFITVCVVGVIPMAGWKLGFLESLNLVLVVGLAVDYVVHLAEGYSRSVHNERLGRVQDTLEEVGISVLSGACTTLGAAFFMLFAVILFFTQFGVFMFCTIGFSILFALGFFVTIMGIMGPQGETGSLQPLYRKCFPCCYKESK